MTVEFVPAELGPQAESIRTEVRAFLAEASRAWSVETRARSWVGFDRAFTKAVGTRGWIGMTWPKRYGGHERSAFERYVVLEEMLAAGAPVCGHWIADRQSGPMILRVGTEAQRQRFLPGIAAGDLAFCIGMSEPGAGSDLASLRSRATRDGSDWRLNGRKIWTTNAQRSDWMIGLFRTSGNAESRQAGLSQFLIDLKTPGIDIRPIPDMSGAEDFNEITFDDVRVPGDLLVGQEGGGWGQVTAELAFERSGPDRFLSALPLLERAIPRLPQSAAAEIGRFVAGIAVLREMSISVAGQLAQGVEPLVQASIVKELGSRLEQATPDRVAALIEPGLDPELDRMLATVTQLAPTYSLRGGTREILRGIIARGLGLR